MKDIEKKRAAHIENQYGEVVVELDFDGAYYSLPGNFTLDYLDIGDVYTVVADDVEGEDDD